MLLALGICPTLVHVPAFSLSDSSHTMKEKKRKTPFYYFTPAGPVYAFLANPYWGPADVGRRTVCSILSTAFLCLSAPPLRRCSLAIVQLCLAGYPTGTGWAKGMCGQNANSVSLSSSIKACESACLCLQGCCHVRGHRGQDVGNFRREITLKRSESAQSHCTGLVSGVCV